MKLLLWLLIIANLIMGSLIGVQLFLPSAATSAASVNYLPQNVRIAK